MKIAGSYASLIAGVSQQAPELRNGGQHQEQINMVPDPVQGLARRKGSVLMATSPVPTSTDPAYTVGSGAGYTTIEHKANGKDYVLLLRKLPAVAGANTLRPVECYCITDNKWTTVSWNAPDAIGEDFLTANGVSAAVNIGQYTLFGLNNLKCTNVSAVRYDPTNALTSRGIVWIRGGAYNRTYAVRFNGTTYSYTTPDASVAGSAAAIAPAAIAASLSAAISGSSSSGAYILLIVTGGADISVSDGGDGSLMRGVKNVTDDITKLPQRAVDGQIVKVQTSPTAWFYMQAHGKTGYVGQLDEVIWRECAGESQGASVTGLGKIRIIAGTGGAPDALYVGVQQAGNLNGLVHMPAVPEAIPTVVPSAAGDTGTAPIPRWMTNRITYMGLFQDRLLVASDAALSVSGAGDYLNFFRTTMLTVPISDGFEMVAQGGEDDTLRHGVPYNRNLVIFGDKRQYVIGGNQALTPTSANMTIMTVYPDATECRPAAAGGQIYYARNREGSVSVHQIQPGVYVDSAESFPTSAQISTYIPGPAVDITAIPGAPAMLVVRTNTAPNRVYVFSYLDAPDGRKQGAWYTWEFNPACGQLLGLHSTPAGLLLLWVRKYSDGTVVKVGDLLPLAVDAPTMPYLDSLRPAPEAGGAAVPDTGYTFAFAKGTHTRFLIGAGNDSTAEVADLVTAYPEALSTAMVGLSYNASVTVTNPYPRDQQGRALLTGRTVVTKLSINAKNSSGVQWDLTAGGATTSNEFNGKRLGDPINIIGTIPISSSIVSIPIGRETRSYTLTLAARKWFPLNLVGIEWTGQSFNRTPRA